MNRRPSPLPPLAALIGLLALPACSGRLDSQEATTAAIKASQLFQPEFAAAAPKLAPEALQQALQRQAEALPPPQGEGPALKLEHLDPGKPRFVTPTGPGPQYDAIEALCQKLPDHDLEPGLYPCAEMTKLAEAITNEEEALHKDIASAHLEEEHIQRLSAHLMTLEGEVVRREDGTVDEKTLVAIMFGRQDFSTPLPHIEQRLGELEARTNAQRKRLAQLELVAHQVALRYAWDQGAAHAGAGWERVQAHRKWLDDLADEEERRTGDAQSQLRMTPPQGWPASAIEARQRALDGAMSLLAALPVADALRAMEPDGDQYPRLVEAHVRYRKLAAQGSFEALPAKVRSFTRGRPSPVADTLRRRLAQEGFQASAEADPGVVDGALVDALKRYQEAHQLNPSGKLDKPTLASLSVGVEQKLARIRLALQKWREAIPRLGDHIFVNIPDFHGEFWVKGQRQHRFRVVVGDPKSRYVKGKGRTFINATPETFALIDRVVYNPYWNVPKRIFQKEILGTKGEEMEDDTRKDFLQGKGFEVMGHGTDYEWVRQPPGPGNALGQVKIIFPNPNEIYLHDTQSKNLFSRPTRAFSHGCVRVHKPLILARLLLEHDGSYDASRIERALDKYENTPIFLRSKIPIYIDYITVRVDDDGQIRFLTDVYRKDDERLERLTARAER